MQVFLAQGPRRPLCLLIAGIHPAGISGTMMGERD